MDTTQDLESLKEILRSYGAEESELEQIIKDVNDIIVEKISKSNDISLERGTKIAEETWKDYFEYMNNN